MFIASLGFFQYKMDVLVCVVYTQCRTAQYNVLLRARHPVVPQRALLCQIMLCSKVSTYYLSESCHGV